MRINANKPVVKAAATEAVKAAIDPDVITVNKAIDNITQKQAIATAGYLAALGVPSLGIFIDTDVNGPAEDKYLTLARAAELGVVPEQVATYVSMTKAPANDEEAGEYQNLGEVIDTVRRAPNAVEAAVNVYTMTAKAGITYDQAKAKVLAKVAGSIESAVAGLTEDFKSDMLG